MNLFKSTIKSFTFGAVVLSLLLSTYALADGTRQVSPTNSANGTALVSAPDVNIGPYRNASDNKRLRFTIVNNVTENLYFGFQPRTYDNNFSVIKTNAYYRIFNAAGTQVAGPTLLASSTGAGFIANYTQAFAGPNIAGATPTGYTPIVFNPTTSGDFYIELYSSNDAGVTADVTTSGRVTFPFFDLTVSTSANVQSIGRLWNKEWGLVTTNLTSGNFEQALSSSFTGKFIAYTPDKFKLQVNFSSGFRPLAYQVAMNYGGPGSTGVFADDRKSRNSNVSVPTIVNGYKVFLTDPDDVAFPDGIVGTAAITKKIFGCSGNYYIPYYKDQPGDIALLLDLNGVAGYQVGSTDILLEEFNQPAGNNVFLWNGLNGLGVQVPINFTAQVTAVLYQGRTNLPMIDAELNTNGISVTGIFPATGNRRLYWDDTNLTPFGTCLTQEENETTGGIVRSGLFDGVFGPTHAWDGSNPGLAVPATSGSQGSSTIGALCDDYGNNRTINTWFYASDIVSNTLTLTLPTCDNDNDGIADNIDLDDDNDGIYDVVEYVGFANPWADADADGIPNFLDPSTTGFIDVNFDGVDDRYDFDLDGIINQFDQDTDNDGIPDNIEAQTTMGYVGPTGAINSSGVYPNYFALGGLTPVNTDGTDNPDYKDLNSDNEGGNDTAEAGITLSGLDADNDGLDNAQDATPTTGYGDVNGIYDNTQFDNFPDVDVDAQTGGDVDWRDAIFNDHDNDGVPDLVDLDDDNDGILDTVENNGLADPLADADNDGILNYLDPTFPGRVDVNNDGVDDRYDFDLDGVINEWDLDSDNDGIFDVLEAGGVDSDNNGTANDDDNNVNNTATNGIPTSAGTGTTPLDFGSNGTPNYLNLDSDEDGCFDVREAGFVDQNSDGRLGTSPTLVNANGRVTGTTVTNGYTGTNVNVTTAGTIGAISTQPPASTSIATGGSGTISVSATGSGLAYQWQISTNGGTAWINLANGGTSPAYSGVTTASLGLSNVPATSNTHRFRVLITSPTHVCTNLTSTSSILSVSASADLSITKVVTSSPNVIGGTVTYTITVTNNGPSISTGFSVQDNLPSGLTYNSHTAPTTGSFNSTTMLWSAATSVLNPTQTATMTLTCNILSTGTYTNQAIVTGNISDPSTANNTVNTPLVPSASANIAVLKTASSMSPQVGTNVTFTIVASNAGPSPATSVSVVDNLPAGYTLVGTPSVSTGTYSAGTWSIPTLGVGASNNQTMTIVATVVANQVAAAYANTATVSSSTPDPNTGNNSSTVTPTPVPVADLQITKTISPANPAVGSTVTFTLKVKNNGLSHATGVQVIDNIAAASGFTFGTLTPPVGTTWTPGTNTWAIGNLNNGDSVLWSFTAVVNATGNYTNTATVSGGQIDNTPTNNSSSATAGAVAQADLAILKSASTLTPLVGGQITFTLTATNNGPSNATAVNVFDNIPAGYTNVTSVPAGAFVGNTWAIGNLSSGASTSILITADVLATGPYTNVATISGAQNDPTSSNDTSRVVVTPIPVSNLSIVKTVSSTTPNVGSNVTFTITVTNNGPSTATNVTVIDTLKTGYTYVGFTAPTGMTYNTTGIDIWKFTPSSSLSIASGASAVFTITATVRASGVYSNCANVTGAQFDPNLANNRTCAASITPVPQTDLSITKTVSSLSPNVGSTVTFTLTVNNAGPSNATGVTMTDIIPTGYTFQNTIPAGVGTYNSGSNTYTWLIGTLNSGPTTQSVQIVALVNPTGNYQNCASVSGVQIDPNSANNTACVTLSPVPQANLSIIKSATPTSASVGDVVTFGITVTNNGPSAATNVIVYDTLPAGYIYTNSFPGGVYSNTSHLWNLGSLSSGSSTNLLITAVVAPNGTLGNYTNTATVSSTINDPVPTDNSDTARVNVTQVANLAIAKSYSPSNPTVGSQIVFSITASNLGTSNATLVQVNDPLPSGYSLDSIVLSTGTYTSPNWIIGNLSASTGSNSATMLVYAHVLATGNLTNTAIISGNEPDPNTSNNTVSVTPGLTNLPPVANNDTTSTIEDNAVTINVVNPNPVSSSTDTDVDGTVNPASVDLNPFVAGIQSNYLDVFGNNWSVTATGEVTFSPNLNFNGTASIPYTVLDDDGAVSNQAFIFIYVTPVNDAPIANNEIYSINEDSTLVANIIANDTDVDGTIDPTTVDLNPSLPGIQDTLITTVGTWTVNTLGILTFVPIADTCGFTFTLPYTVNDNLGLTSNIGSVIVSVICVNDPPVAIDDDTTTLEDTPVTLDILANDYDIDGYLLAQTTDLDTLTAGVQTTFTNVYGTWTLDTLGNLTYTPALNFNGTAIVYYTVCDTSLLISNVATVTITVIPVNDTVPFGNEYISVAEDSPANISPDLTANNIDPDGSNVTITAIISTTAGGIVVINTGDTTVSYTPPANFNGIDTIVYTVCDSGIPLPIICINDTLFVTVFPVNDPPVAIDDDTTTLEDTPITFNILANDYDPDGSLLPQTTDLDTLALGVQDTITNVFGVWIMDGLGNLTYTPALNFTGVALIYYTVCDTSLLVSNVATVTITVIPVNDAPILDNEYLTTLQGDPVSGDLTDVGDSDVDGNLVVTPFTGPTTSGNGNIVINSNGTFTYTPISGFIGLDTFVVVICDDGTPLPAICVNDTIFITVNPTIVPVAINDTTTTLEDTPVTFNITGNDIDTDGTIISSTVDLDPGTPGIQDSITNTFGTWVVDVLGNVTFTPALNYNGTATATYVVNDNDGATSNIATLVVIVQPVNDAPVIDNDYLFTSMNVSGSGDIIDAGDTDVDGNLTVGVIVQPSQTGGTFVIAPNGNYTYTPFAGYSGNDTIIVQVCDDGFPLPSICVNDTIFIVVIPSLPPVANNDSTSVLEDTPGGVTFSVTNNDTDDGIIVTSTVDLDTLTPGIQNTITNQYGTWTTSALGTVTFVPLANYCGLAYANYFISDNNNIVSNNPALITVNVICVNDAPVTTDLTVITSINTPVGVNVGAGTSDLENNPLTYSYNPPTGTTVTIDGNGTITVTPPLNFVGSILIPFTVCDLSPYNVTILCDSGIVKVNVLDTVGPNIPPVANYDLVTTPKDSSVIVNPLGNDYDVDGDPLVVTIVTGPTVLGSTGTVNPITGEITYIPAPGFTGMDSIQYQICDDGTPPLCDVAYIIITVSPGFDNPNTPPIATDDYTTINEDSSVTFPVLNNDTDPNGDAISNPTIASGPNNGTATVNSAGEITYTPSPNFYGQDTIAYVICDNGTTSLCDTGLFIITVVPTNDGPTTTDITVTTSINTPIGVNVGAGTSDPENNPLFYTYDFTQLPGTTVTGNGAILVAPGSVVGTYIIPFEVCDLSGFVPVSLCDSGYITVIVVDTTGPNLPPVANDDQVTTPKDSSIVINPLANDFDPDLDPLTVTILTGPINPGSTAGPVGANGTIPFTPAPGFVGLDSIQYQICDIPGGLCDIAWIYVTVSPVVDTPNVAPIAVDDFDSTNEDSPVTILVLNNDSDPNGNGLNNPTVFIQPTNGTATSNGTGGIVYNPNPNFNGVDTFTYVVCDNGNPSLCDTAVVIVTVNPGNDGPTVNDITVITSVDTPIGVNVGAGASDPENNPLTYTYDGSLLPPTVTFTVTGNGVITVTPGPVGTYTIPFTVCDTSAIAPTSICATGTITVIVIDTTGGVNNAPIANNDQVTTPMDSSVVVNPLANDFDVDGDSLFVTILNGPYTLGAIASVDPITGLITYIPAPGTTGPDSILYQICDNGNPVLCDDAYIYINVSPVVDTPNVAPLATDDYATTDIATPVTVSVLNNDSDPNGNTIGIPMIYFLSTYGPSNGLPFVNPNGTITYTPDPTFIGTDTVEYVICDNGIPSLCDTALLIITINPINQGPTTTDVTVITSVGIPVGVNVGAGTSDPENNPITYTYGTPIIASGGPIAPIPPITIDGNGTITVTPPAGFLGTISIPFTACDSSVILPSILCVNGTITVIVVDTTGGTNDAPIANNDLVTTPMGTTVTVNPLGNDTDANGDVLTVSFTPNGPSNGIATLNTTTGSVEYTPNPLWFGIDSIEYSICDAGPLCDTAWIIITVSPVVDTPNVAPIATNDYAFINEDTPITVAVLNNDSDPNGDNIGSPTIVGGPSFGTAVVNPGDSTITYTPWPNFYGIDTITYQICDDGNPVMCDIGQLIITVSPANDAPITNDVTVITSVNTPIGVNVGAGTSDPENNPITITYGSPNIAGTTVDSTGVGTINVTPPLGFIGTITIPFQVCDSSQYLQYVLCDSGYITVIVVDTTDGINDAPIANNDLVTTTINTSVIINPLGNDTDANNDPLTVTLVPGSPVVGPGGGTATVGPNGLVTYVPLPTYTGVDSIMYSICDAGPLCDTAWIIITISPVVDTPNVQPIATDDFASTPIGTTVTVAVLNNDSDPNGNTIGNPTVVVLPGYGPYNGSATVIGNVIDYSPAPGFTGVDTFSYVICDNGNPVMCDTAEVYINVFSPNDPPTPGNEVISTVKWCSDTVFATIRVLQNNTDPNGDSLIVSTSGTSTMGGTVTVNSLGEIIYAPAQNYVGQDTVIYTVCDDFVPAACITDTIFITVLPDNDCDGISDPIDIDDDNDGIQDIIECSTANGACDTDGDGIPDYFDLDSDNDGIPDIVEAGGAQYDLNFDGIIDDTTDTDNDGLFDVADGNNGGTYLPNPDMDGDTRPNFQDLDSDNDGITDIIEAGGVDVDGNGLIDLFNDSNNDGMDDNDEIFDPRNTDGDLNYDFLDLDADNDGISDILESGQPDTNGDGMIDGQIDVNNDGFADSQVGVFAQDYDNDGIEDYIDLDSDNDAIPDVRENGYQDNNQDGLVDNYVDANNNGWNDSSEGTTLLNSDSDPLADLHDLDSDQDGIPDVVEGGQLDLDMNGLVDNYIDLNLNGWSDATEGDVISDVNSDGIPDYLDHDSDSDGCLDVTEGGFFDFDQDGVIDNFTDANNDGWDTNAFGQIIPDTDADNIFDFRDLDSDGDGLLDISECGLDCDNDGISDIIDADPCEDLVQIPDGFTPNGDGYNDLFVITGIERFPDNEIQIFNRWGNVVYTTKDYQNDWAGTSQSQYNIGGEKLPTGTYYYVFNTGDDNYGTITGYIYIQR